MIEPLQPAISVGDLTLLEFIGDNPTQKSEQIPESFLQLEEFLDPSLDAIPGSSPLKKSPGSELDELNEEEEEELEWLSNKDAFPPLETSFEVRKSTAVLSAPNFKAPVRARSKVGRKKRRIFGRVGEERRRCRHCEAEETPQWRVGPEGPKTLCNACGVRFRKGRLFPEYRPVNSPTFLAELHSSSHRRVIGVRKKRGRPRKRMIIL